VSDGMKFSDAADEVIPMMSQDDRERMPVLNREPRPAISTALRRGLWLRDSGLCWICGHTVVREVADHVRPRSSWPADLLRFADRSDNLRLACWDCNEAKSNFTYPGGDLPLGVTVWCIRCTPDMAEPFDPERRVRCFCVKCGMGGLVPDESFYLSGEPMCVKHPGRPARGCDRCAEEVA
jgi:hypothetical protein